MEAQCAETLCRMFPLDENIDLKAIAIKARRARRLLERERFYGHRALPPSAAPPPPPPAPRQDIPRLGLLMSGHFARELCDEVWATRVGHSGRSSTPLGTTTKLALFAVSCNGYRSAMQSRIESSPPFTHSFASVIKR